MSTTRLLIVGVGAAAGLAAAFLAFNLSSSPQQVVQQVIQPEAQGVNVLVAKEPLRMGVAITSDQLMWARWPESSISSTFMTEDARPEALSELVGYIPRAPIFSGEPIHNGKLVEPGKGFMAAILPSGKRAIATDISVATGAGGFILPNDRVDVLMTRTVDDRTITDTILENVRVLAIDQVIEEQEDGSPVVVGSTATLELNSDQTHILTVAQQVGEQLTLALRSLQDIEKPATSEANYLLSGGRGSAITIFKNGQRSIAVPN